MVMVLEMLSSYSSFYCYRSDCDVAVPCIVIHMIPSHSRMLFVSIHHFLTPCFVRCCFNCCCFFGSYCYHCCCCYCYYCVFFYYFFFFYFLFGDYCSYFSY